MTIQTKKLLGHYCFRFPTKNTTSMRISKQNYNFVIVVEIFIIYISKTKIKKQKNLYCYARVYQHYIIYVHVLPNWFLIELNALNIKKNDRVCGINIKSDMLHHYPVRAFS